MSSLQPQKAKQLVGVVVQAGRRLKTVKVRIPTQKWNERVQKNFKDSYSLLANDPNRSTCTGDVVQLQPGWRVSKHVRHVVGAIVTPFGPALADRPPVPTADERLAQRQARRQAKDERQAARGRVAAVRRLEEQKQAQRIVEHDVRMRERRNERTELLREAFGNAVELKGGNGNGTAGGVEGEEVASNWWLQEKPLDRLVKLFNAMFRLSKYDFMLHMKKDKGGEEDEAVKIYMAKVEHQKSTIEKQKLALRNLLTDQAEEQSKELQNMDRVTKVLEHLVIQELEPWKETIFKERKDQEIA